jgi:hypothetical protein
MVGARESDHKLAWVLHDLDKGDGVLLQQLGGDEQLLQCMGINMNINTVMKGS